MPNPAEFQTISSLPSSPPPAAVAEDGTSTKSPANLPRRAASPTFSSSSTADHDDEGSSPVLPPLPAPTFRGRTFEHRSRTPPSNSPVSSHYYTASWGSPYQQPAGSLRTRSHGHSYTLSSEPSEDSPIRHLEFHTPFLRPAPTFARLHSDPEFVSHDGLISAAVLANRARRPATGLTEDWIRQHTGGDSAERNHWLSDDPGDSEHSSLSGSISGENRDWLGADADPRTPTLKRFLAREKAHSRAVRSRGHRRQLTTDTLTQEDFAEDFLDHSIPKMSLTNENDMEMAMNTSSPENERPPTPPPKDWRAPGLPVAVEAPPKVPTPAPGPPRLKKKVPWKGKNIMVLLPMDDERGHQGKAPAPLTEKDVGAMLKEWEQLGYDTAGFNLGPNVAQGDESSQGQSRSPWPLVKDLAQDRTQKKYSVKIPNRKEWDDAVQELQEAKLRALGVSFGDEDPAPKISPAVSNMNSRRTSMTYPPLPFSPPLPTPSAASSHMTQHQNPFSPLLMPGAGMSTSQSSIPGSIASPVSMHAHMHGKFNPRQSVSFTGSEHPFGSPFQYPQANSPGVWSPQQMLYQQGAARGGSPSVQNLGSLMSPASPFSPDGYFPQGGDVMSQMHQRQQLLQTQLSHQQQLQLQGGAKASPRLQEVREIDDEDESLSKSPSKTPEARIQNNPNDLQKEIDDAEYHLEEQMQRELEHDDYSPHSDKDEDKFPLDPVKIHARNTSSMGLGASRFANSDGPVLHHPQPHSRGHSLSQRPFQENESGSKRLLNKPDLSDVETNPSNLGTPIQSTLSGSGPERSLSAASNPWAESDAAQTDNSTVPPRKGHKTTMSTLNVAAKEFKFNPSNSFIPSQFAFNSNNFQSPINAFTAFAPPVSAPPSHLSHGSIANSSKINIAASAFTPGHKEFSFSASGPSFRPDAPAFTPLITTFSNSTGSGSDGPRSSIFGNIDLSSLGIQKQSKKNKAIPIIRPDSRHSQDAENDDVEDDMGRLTQGAGRIKRARGAKDEGDSVPLFAEPTMPLGETTREQSPPKESLNVSSALADKENSAPHEGTPAESSARTEESGKDFVPWEFKEKKQAEDFNAARPFTSRRYGSGLPAYGNYKSPEDETSAPFEDPQKSKGHKKNISSLSATAKPFEFRPGAFNFKFGKESEQAAASPSVHSLPPSLPVSAGLSASKYARSPSPPIREPTPGQSPDTHMQPEERTQFQGVLPHADGTPEYDVEEDHEEAFQEDSEDQETFQEQSLEEIDEVMRLMNEAESAPRPDSAPFHQPNPQRQINLPDPDNSSPIRLLPQHIMRSDAPSPSPRRFQALPGETRIFSRVNDDPFIADESPIHHLSNMDSLPPSEWDDVLSETEEAKLLPRAQFFDNHVNDLVGGLLSQRLEPLERTLENVQMSLDMMAARGQSRRRERGSFSGALSDADDEDDDNPRRSLSPRRDKKLDRIRAIVIEALAAQNPRPASASTASAILPDFRNVLQAIEEMREQFGQSMHLDLRNEDLKKNIEEAVERRMPASSRTIFDETASSKEAEYKAEIAELEERLLRSDNENMSRSADVEERLLRAGIRTEEETKSRRAAEDRLAEVQRLLRISSEEETRLREAMDERDVKIREIANASDLKVRNAEDQRAKTTMRIALLEASQDNSQKTQMDLQNRLAATETDLRDSRRETSHWQMEAERALEAARRHSEDAEQANETNKELRRTMDTLKTQMEESIRVREGMRGKLMSLQADMAAAAREISEENARRAKKEAELVARQEVLDARLQAEARTRERLELEIERLEGGERDGMRAVSEAKKLEAMVDELRSENHSAHQDIMRFKREFEEARESGLAEVQRTRHYMQLEIDTANNQVNVVREDLENQVLRARAEIDQVKLDADTTRVRSEMLLEEAETSKQTLLKDLKNKHADILEDLQTQHERQLSNITEDAQRHEQHLLERLSLSAAKTEHLQDRVSHLEEKLEIASQAALAAASAAKNARSSSIASPTSTSTNMNGPTNRSAHQLPEKISPQALRESIMVLQEQLQAREQTIESLTSQLSTVDLNAPTKIIKRDDEITWLRELLSVRKSDLQDIVTALQSDRFDAERVRDAAIRLHANLQMEEQERERAANGGSALSNLPSIANTLRNAASPRVAQAVGPLAAAWGNWRKGRGAVEIDGENGSGSSTPTRETNSFLSGLMTPPATNTSSSRGGNSSGGKQPTAFGSTGQRFTSAQLANRPRNLSGQRRRTSNANTNALMSAGQGGSNPSRANKASPSKSSGGQSSRSQGRPGSSSTVLGLDHGMGGSRGGMKGVPSTPPMMRKSSYDADALSRAEDYSDAGFYDDESFAGEGDDGLEEEEELYDG
ncbi:related to myosin heavy chain [Rhynchosporium secalis]|uniref:Related to myosin heavy chain n=1 Tax=Rhynchosporium secalis TaxID=38038 RepID=A0A1E1MHE9_RHYSE|nr:related to myosin heavy chain [Rhynchosporium secalis]